MRDTPEMKYTRRRGLLTMLTLVSCLLASTFDRASAEGNIVQHTQGIQMPAPIAPTLRWTQRINGLCGQTCRNGPRHMYSAAFGDTLLVSWMAADESDTWRHYGNVSTFKVSESGEFTHAGDVSFDGKCAAIYGMTTNADGSVIAILCEGIKDAPLLAGAVNLLDSVREADCSKDWEGACYPIGHYSALDSPLYLFEYRQGTVTSTPDKIVKINHAVGGWRYGHHELSLNAAEDTYFVSLKVTAGPSADNRHEGLTHFGLRRLPDWEYVRLTDGWGCGPGHVLANRLAYNRAEDSWSKLCTLDWCKLPDQYENAKCDSVTWTTVPGVTKEQTVKYEGEELFSLDHPGKSWTLSGGGHALLSLGADGWLVLASGPGYVAADPKPETLGLLRLPLSVPELRASVSEGERNAWNWLTLPAPRADRMQHTRAGMGNMAYFDTAGEKSERLLVGFSPSMETQGITSEYVVSEIDREGRLRGEPLALKEAGWGEDNLWATMPSSGCVVFPFAWVGDKGPGQAYPLEGTDDPSTYPTMMQMTSLCRGTAEAPPVTGSPSPPDDERWPAPKSSKASKGCSLSGGASETGGLAAWFSLAALWCWRSSGKSARRRRGATVACQPRM